MGASISLGSRVLGGLIVFFLLFSASAQALNINLEFVDETLVANQSVEIRAQYDGCNPPVPNVDGIQFEVRRDGSIIDFYYSTQTQPCGVPPPGPTLTYRLGYLPEGDYTLRYVSIESTEPFPPSMDGLDPEVVAFSVGGPVAQPIPALSAASVAVLALLVLFVALGSRLSARARSRWLDPAGSIQLAIVPGRSPCRSAMNAGADACNAQGMAFDHSSFRSDV